MKKILRLFAISLALLLPVTSHAFLSESYYYFIQAEPTSRHMLNAISYNGNLVQLTNGSYWEIDTYSAETLISWQPGDLISITPNVNFFNRGYRYSLQNISNGTYVSANLSISPFIDSPETLLITAINYDTNQIVLDCHSYAIVCEVNSYWSQRQFRKWLVGDYVLLGNNPNSYSSYDYILINTSIDLNNYLQAKVYR